MKRWLKVLLIIMAALAFIIFVLPLLIPLPPAGVAAETLADEGGYFVEVNGLQTYVLEAGPTDGPVVLLLHGFGGSTFSWREQMDALAEAGFRAVAFDRPPYGLSAKTGDLPLSQADQAGFTAAFMDVMAIDEAALVGHSMGGGVIGQFAALYPERVTALAFVDGAPAIAASGADGGQRGGGLLGVPSFVGGLLDFAPFQRWGQILLRTFLQPEAFTSLQTSAYYDPADVTPEVAAGYQRQLQVQGWDEGMLRLFGNMNGGFAPLTSEQLAAWTMPVAIFWGENDTWVPIASGERLRDALSNANWFTYPQTGHLPMEEQPDLFNRDLLAFLTGDPS
jgi:pimeloyl-ACP methyl ester carboxylesterase